MLRGGDLITRLGSCSESMANWGEDFNRKFRKKIADFQAKIEKLRRDYGWAETEEFKRLRSTLSDLLIQEEEHWKQRAKVFWLA